MSLVRNWRSVIRYAWSIRLLILAGLLSAAEVALPLIQEIVMVPRGLFALLTAGVAFIALIARLLAQKSVGEK